MPIEKGSPNGEPTPQSKKLEQSSSHESQGQEQSLRRRGGPDPVGATFYSGVGIFDLLKRQQQEQKDQQEPDEDFTFRSLFPMTHPFSREEQTLQPDNAPPVSDPPKRRRRSGAACTGILVNDETQQHKEQKG